MDALGITAMLGKTIPFGWIGLAASLVFAGFMAWMVLGYHNKLRAIQNAGPNIVLSKEPYYVDKRGMLDPQYQFKGEQFWAYDIKFCNKPRVHSIEANAKGVWGEITFFDLQGQLQLGPIKARWRSIEQPSRRPLLSPEKQYYQVDLDASGLEDRIILAIKYDNDTECYAFNDESYRFPECKNPHFKLTGDQLEVLVKLEGQNLTETRFWFRLYNDGIRKPLRIIYDPTKS